MNAKAFDTRDLKETRTLLKELASKGVRVAEKSFFKACDSSTNVREDRAVVRLRKCPSPGCAQLKFKFSEMTVGRAANRVYKRL
jgi:hypothetical protein